jgi:hypothetical protein
METHRKISKRVGKYEDMEMRGELISQLRVLTQLVLITCGI